MAAMTIRPVAGDAFGIAGGQATELFEPVEAPLDDIAVLVGDRVEDGWSAAGCAAVLAPGNLVGSLRADERDTPSS